METKIDIVEVLKNLSSIRFLEDEKGEFWDKYLKNISLLTKSPLAIIISKEDESWQTEKECILDEKIEKFKDDILKSTIKLANRSLSNIFAYERYNNKEFHNYFIVTIAQESLDQDKDFVLILLIENHNKIEFSNLIIRASLSRDIPLSYLYFQNQEEEEEEKIAQVPEVINENRDNLKQILEILDVIIYEKKFILACMKIADEFSVRFNCHKVSIGWENNDYIKPIAISHIEHFTKSSDVIKALEAVFEESYEQDEEIFYPFDENSRLIVHSHKLYLTEHKLDNLYSFPIRLKDDVIGVISFEKEDGELLDEELESIRVALNYIAPNLKKIYLEDKNIFQKTIDGIKNSFSFFLGTKHTLKKLLTVSITILLTWIIFGKMEYKIESVTTIKTDNIAYISAPYDGIVEIVNIDAGDIVKKGDSLLNFDIQELSLKKLEINSEIIKYITETEKTRAKRELADMKIAIAKQKQATTNLKRIEYYLNQSRIVSPFDGIVVKGDREELLGSPFSKGDIILEIANPTDLYAKIKVLEEYIDEIKVGQIAELNLLSRPDRYFNVKIEKIIPMAKVDDVNGNIFIIKVIFLDEIEDWMRPGMSGMAKIKIEDRSILWILTHKISDYLHMNIWW